MGPPSAGSLQQQVTPGDALPAVHAGDASRQQQAGLRIGGGRAMQQQQQEGQHQTGGDVVPQAPALPGHTRRLSGQQAAPVPPQPPSQQKRRRASTTSSGSRGQLLQDASPTSPDDGLIQIRPDQTLLGCLLNTPYPLQLLTGRHSQRQQLCSNQSPPLFATPSSAAAAARGGGQKALQRPDDVGTAASPAAVAEAGGVSAVADTGGVADAANKQHQPSCVH
jgi:hypothetical protein